LTRAQWQLLFILASVQFTHIVDFVIIQPLATQLQDDLDITIRQFGVIVSAYGFAAALSGLALAPLLDRFDRKQTLLTLYGGFTLGTLLCAFAPNYPALVGARVLTGAFGGVAAATVLAIVGDAFPPGRRATAMGVVMSAFSVASIAGVPAGLFLAQSFSFSGTGTDGWRVSFATLGTLSALLLVLAAALMSPIRGHLASEQPRPPFLEVVFRPAHVSAYALMVMLVLSTSVMFPFLSAFLVKNVGRPEKDLPLVFLCGGAATLLSTNAIGRLADYLPRLVVFRVFALLTAVPVLVLTHLPAGTSLAMVLLATTAMMVVSSGRMVPAMAMVTSSAEPRYRGSFLSINSSVQQMAIGVAPLIANLFLSDDPQSGALVGFNALGYFGAIACLVSLVLAGFLRPIRTEVRVLPDETLKH
jgi:predicted MFS family arabinose efflux permease